MQLESEWLRMITAVILDILTFRLNLDALSVHHKKRMPVPAERDILDAFKKVPAR